ncbi:UBX domain-containing protein 4 isoform X1 [Xenopus laevis]|uniref:UBX domain-containing protein 4 n=1 Tax=Xenopus laevis TaxID=8355 RepID=A0A8J0U060_XENLA|nr:UBX domain-containing protein 4 isoform X1 [Xenopus laevis]
MLWFQGSIPEAIAAAKQNSSVFVVFVAGEDEQSVQMSESWANEQVIQTSLGGVVAIKLDSQSEACLQFSQIYPVVCVPSSFFIGENGIPLEVIAGSISAEELVAKIAKVKQMHSGKKDGPLVNAKLPESLPKPCSDGPCPVVPHASPPDNVQPAGTMQDSSAPTTELPTPLQALPSDHESEALELVSESVQNMQSEEELVEKVQRVTQKLEEKREHRKKEEEQRCVLFVTQNEIKKEIDRRKMGKEMLEYKRKQEEDLPKRALEERNREKAEEKAARDRIRQQIAQDRADRAARYAKNSEEIEALKAAELQAQQAERDSRREAAQKERSTIARIQFRLPDGSSFTNQFASEAPLEEARCFAVQTVGNTYGKFSLATMFPRREFTEEDYGKSLLSLELAPGASVVLLPAGRSSHTVVQSSEGGVWSFLGTILFPLLAVWRFLSNFLFSSPSPSQPVEREAHPQHESTNPTASSSSEPNRDAVRKRVVEKRPEQFKKEGKVYRLRSQDDEDENNTWNGNSTQQM